MVHRFLFYEKEKKTDWYVFLENLNKNNRNNTLTWDISSSDIAFLDLKIIQEENTISTKTHFKNVGKNIYLPMESCHHQNWLCNMSTGQLMHLWRNCTGKDDFLVQEEKIGHRFVHKAYDNKQINSKISEVEKRTVLN